MPASGDGNGETWASWPCSLLRIDERGAITAVNDRFLHQLGYERGDVVGRMKWTDALTGGSRLLFEAQIAPVLAMDGAIEEVMLDLAAADGRRIPALLSAEAIVDEQGVRTGARIALMTVPDRRDYENNLRDARKAAEHATAESAVARTRLELLAAANAALASSVDVDVALRRLARTLVGEVADWCVIYAIDEGQAEAPKSWAAAHCDPAQQAAVDTLAELIPIHATPTSAVYRVLNEGRPILLAQVSNEHLSLSTDNPAVADIGAQLGGASAMVVPSFARGHRVAVIVLSRGPDRAPFTEDDLAYLTDLGARTGIAIDNLRRHAREHSNSVTLQHALLTPPPSIEPFKIATRYLPATDGAEVGGDWYDAFALPGGGVAIVVGDVVGHDIHAATQMGQLRGIIRTIASAIAGTPADTLRRTDQTAKALQVDTLASAIVAQIEFEPSDRTGGRIALWSNAGHPPPILIERSGAIRLLEERSDPLLGVHLGVDRHDHSVDLHPGDTLVLYTDGLIERPDQDFDTGLRRLTDSVVGGHLRSADELADVVVAGHDGRRDDIAILVLRIAD